MDASRALHLTKVPAFVRYFPVRMIRFYCGSVMVTIWSARTFVSVWVCPLGQYTVMESTAVAFPIPKCASSMFWPMKVDPLMVFRT